MKATLRDSEHLLRALGLFVLALLAFLVLREWMIPDDFGRYGFFRAGALTDNADRPLRHAGRAWCESCHDDVAEARRGSAHERVNCEACHGPLAAHAEDPSEAEPPSLPDEAELCMRCHFESPAKSTRFPQVDRQEHAGADPCGDCHEPHNPGFPEG